MGDLAAYYRELATWEEKAEIDLIATWERGDIRSIAEDFKSAFQSSGFQTRLLTVPDDLSNQAIGNRVADFFVQTINNHLRALRIEDCSGAGYPDKRLRRLSDSRIFVFEMKATSEFDPNDSNRIVLTSSSEKLRRYCRAPINHLLVTACYHRQANQIEIHRLRLDFLEPSTLVNVRLEASVSQRILARGDHQQFTF